ncbi:MAG: orotate phosphoribosyltransferase [Bacillota bacterium]
MPAERVARWLLKVKAVFCDLEHPFTFTSGTVSPVYVDMRKVISYPGPRAEIAELSANYIRNRVGLENVDVVAGGETAGIPYAAWVADRLDLPMIYVRKQPKGFGRNAMVEGDVLPGQRVVLVEDLVFNGQSKVKFAEGIRNTGALCEHVLAVFDYAYTGESAAILGQAGIKLHALTNWSVLLKVAGSEGFFSPVEIKTIEEFLSNPRAWSQKHGGV